MAELLSWVDANGTEWPFNNEIGYYAQAGRLGAFAPPVNVIEQPVPGQPGARLREVQVKVRQVDIPLRIYPSTGTPADYRALIRQLTQAVMIGPGLLRATGPDNVPRDLNCVYVGGLEGRETQPAGAISTEVLSFHGTDPYWYDKDFSTLVRSAGAAVQFFPAGGSPSVIHLSPDGILSAFNVENTGDVEAWPVWTLNGPGSGIVLTNVTTGYALDLTNGAGLTLSAIQTLTIDTRPGRKSITLQDGSSQFQYLQFSSALWSLPKGISSIAISMTGATGASLVTMQYKRGWRTA